MQKKGTSHDGKSCLFFIFSACCDEEPVFKPSLCFYDSQGSKYTSVWKSFPPILRRKKKSSPPPPFMPASYSLLMHLFTVICWPFLVYFTLFNLIFLSFLCRLLPFTFFLFFFCSFCNSFPQTKSSDISFPRG